MLTENKKEIVKKYSLIAIFVLVFIIVAIVVLKYQVEGENDMPFRLTKISIISTANGIPNEEAMNRWNFNLVQNNDIYFNFEKNEKLSDQEIIKKIGIENLRVINAPSKGITYFYSPSKEAADWYENDEKYRISNSLDYIGDIQTNIKELKIANQGGIVGIRYAIEDLGQYISEETEIKHDGLLLKEIGIEEENLKSTISFDLVVELVSEIQYKAQVTQKLPLEGVLNEGISKTEITELENVVFRRF